MPKSTKDTTSPPWHISLARFRHFTGRGLAIAEFANRAIDSVMREEGVDSPSDIRSNIYVNVSSKGGRAHPDTLAVWRPYIIGFDGQEEARLRDGLRAFASRQRCAHGDMRPNLEVTVTNAEDDRPVHEMVVLQLDDVIGARRPAPTGYVVYVHTLAPDVDVDAPSVQTSSLSYVGITKQGWQRRLQQHMTAARSRSQTLFHRALRDWLPRSRVVEHRILAVDLTEAAAMDMEYRMVEGTRDRDILARVIVGDDTTQRWFAGTLYPKGLNMIPGGYEGLRYLHRIGALAPRKPVDVDRREELVSTILRDSRRESKPNPLLAALWFDDDYAARIICGPEGRLKPKQVNDARFLHSLGKPVAEIREAVGAKDDGQILRLLRGKTYGRVR